VNFKSPGLTRVHRFPGPGFNADTVPILLTTNKAWPLPTSLDWPDHFAGFGRGGE